MYKRQALALVGALVLASLWVGEPLRWVALGLLVLLLPDRLRAIREHRSAARDGQGDLFEAAAKDVERRFLGQVTTLLFALPAVFALVVVAAVVEDPRVPLLLAGALLLYIPVLFFLRLRVTARERAEVRRWTRLARGLDPQDVDDEDDAGDDDEDDEDEDESWLRLALGILGPSFVVFVVYLGPLLVVFFAIHALRAEDPVPASIAAGALVVAWVLAWKFAMEHDEDGE